MVKQVRSYNELMLELQQLLADMQSDSLDIDTALADYERGKVLIGQLEDYLHTAGNKIVRHKGDVEKMPE